jgi:CheY-like chemotaxis protein
VAKILVAMRDPDERALVVFTLRFAGYCVFDVIDSQGLAALARHEKPDLIITELRMADSEKDDLLAGLMSDPEIAHIPLICLVDERSGAVVRPDLDPRRVNTLVKPISPDQFTRKVNARLKQGAV